jgi:hypothetical protein
MRNRSGAPNEANLTAPNEANLTAPNEASFAGSGDVLDCSEHMVTRKGMITARNEAGFAEFNDRPICPECASVKGGGRDALPTGRRRPA